MADFARFQRDLYPEWEAQFRAADGPGEFSYERGGPTSLYGSTDMLFSRAIMSELALSREQREGWTAVINGFQDPRTGWYRKTYTWTHPREHTTAYAVSALRLIGAEPRYGMAWADALLASVRERRRWLRSVPWSLIWMGSHVVAGRPAILAMTGTMTEEFRDWYFDWLDERVDPSSGFWMRGLAHRLGLIRRPTKHELGGAFHMFFLYEHYGRPWRYPERVIDHALRLQHENGFWDGEYTYCIDLDAIYSMTRSSKLAPGYRSDEIRGSVERYLTAAADLLNDRDRFLELYTNSHQLPGALAAVAECALLYPELVRSPSSWVQTLDYALYI
jgi:hypothetical protein